jgi:hypothetical protein
MTMCDKCDGKSWDEIHAKMAHDIMDHGHQVIAVPDGDPSFAYSAGRCLFDKPEFLVVGGIDPRVAMSMINDAAKIADSEIVENGYVFESDQLIRNFPVKVVEVDPTKTQVFQAKYINGDEWPRVLQLVWPDMDGNFPDDPGYNERLVQPVYALEDA